MAPTAAAATPKASPVPSAPLPYHARRKVGPVVVQQQQHHHKLSPSPQPQPQPQPQPPRDRALPSSLRGRTAHHVGTPKRRARLPTTVEKAPAAQAAPSQGADIMQLHTDVADEEKHAKAGAPRTPATEHREHVGHPDVFPAAPVPSVPRAGGDTDTDTDIDGADGSGSSLEVQPDHARAAAIPNWLPKAREPPAVAHSRPPVAPPGASPVQPADSTKFKLSGVTLKLCGEAEPLTHRLETLRAFLAEELGDAKLLEVYRHVIQQHDDVPAAGVQASILDIVKPRADVLPLVVQLMELENEAFEC